MSNWFPSFVKEQLAVTRHGELLCDGRGYPLMRGASNYYSVFYGVAWFGYAIPLYQGAVKNNLHGGEV